MAFRHKRLDMNLSTRPRTRSSSRRIRPGKNSRVVQEFCTARPRTVARRPAVRSLALSPFGESSCSVALHRDSKASIYEVKELGSLSVRFEAAGRRPHRWSTRTPLRESNPPASSSRLRPTRRSSKVPASYPSALMGKRICGLEPYLKEPSLEAWERPVVRDDVPCSARRCFPDVLRPFSVMDGPHECAQREATIGHPTTLSAISLSLSSSR